MGDYVSGSTYDPQHSGIGAPQMRRWWVNGHGGTDVSYTLSTRVPPHLDGLDEVRLSRSVRQGLTPLPPALDTQTSRTSHADAWLASPLTAALNRRYAIPRAS